VLTSSTTESQYFVVAVYKQQFLEFILKIKSKKEANYALRFFQASYLS